MTISNVKVLDCTFRDGGYYNNWDYEPKTVQRYLQSIAKAGVDIVEIGFRMPPQKEFCGPFAYCTDDFLRSLGLPKGVQVCVMINAKDYLPSSSKTEPLLALNHAFSEKSKSPVELVRIAAHFAEIEASRTVAARLSELGYRVGYNLMQASGKSPDELRKAAEAIASWGCVDVLYFADSFGNMNPSSIKEMVESLRAGWPDEIGIHTHDNMGLALSNCKEALQAKVTWLDATILGMGRGAGNAQTEHLLVELNALGMNQYHPEALFGIVLDEFTALKTKYGWGSSLLYYLSASYNIHPTYVQELLGVEGPSSQHIIDSLEYLRESGMASRYDERRLAKSLSGAKKESGGTWSAKSLKHNGDVMVVGPGRGATAHIDAIKAYLRKNKTPALVLNTLSILPPELVTAHLASHHSKLLTDFDRYKELKRPVILPLGALSDRLRQAVADVEVYDYGLKIQDDANKVGVSDTFCELPTNLVAGYAFAVAIASGAKRILLAGFDGFGAGHPRQVAMQTLIALMKEAYPGVDWIAVTPTTYDLKHGSIYAPGLVN
jgi:4-hydroxy 2-oxovalerate aldolase